MGTRHPVGTTRGYPSSSGHNPSVPVIQWAQPVGTRHPVGTTRRYPSSSGHNPSVPVIQRAQPVGTRHPAGTTRRYPSSSGHNPWVPVIQWAQPVGTRHPVGTTRGSPHPVGRTRGSTPSSGQETTLFAPKPSFRAHSMGPTSGFCPVDAGHPRLLPTRCERVQIPALPMLQGRAAPSAPPHSIRKTPDSYPVDAAGPGGALSSCPFDKRRRNTAGHRRAPQSTAQHRRDTAEHRRGTAGARVSRANRQYFAAGSSLDSDGFPGGCRRRRFPWGVGLASGHRAA
jgi:hypothetical protein